MTPKTSTQRAQALRKRRSEAGLAEVRGIWAPPAMHGALRAFAAQRGLWLDVVAHAADELEALDDETAQVQAMALRELCGPNARHQRKDDV